MSVNAFAFYFLSNWRLLLQTNDPITEAPEANFMKLVQGLIEDTNGREHFLKVRLISYLMRCN